MLLKHGNDKVSRTKNDSLKIPKELFTEEYKFNEWFMIVIFIYLLQDVYFLFISNVLNNSLKIITILRFVNVLMKWLFISF